MRIEDVPLARGAGHTTAVCKAAKLAGAIVVTYNSVEARRLKRDYGVEAVAYYELEKLMGSRKPVLFDPTAVVCAARHERSQDENRIERLEQDKKSLMKNARFFDAARLREQAKRNEAVEKAEKLQKQISTMKRGKRPRSK